MRTVLLAWSPLYVPHVGAGLPSRLSLRRTHPRGGGIGRHFSLTMCGASLRHETSAVDNFTLLTPYRTAVEYGGVSSPGWAGLCRETRPGDRVRLGGRDDRRQDGGRVAASSCGRRCTKKMIAPLPSVELQSGENGAVGGDADEEERSGRGDVDGGAVVVLQEAELDAGRRCAADSVAGSVRRPCSAPRAPDFADDGAAG